MKFLITPSIIATNQTEFDKTYEKIKTTSNVFHLDVMDGIFVKNKSLNFDFILPKNKIFEAHLMVTNPTKWVKKHINKVNLIVFHIESCKNPNNLIELIKQKKKQVGIAIKPETTIHEIKNYLPIINRVIIMTVNPGKYGAKFQEKTMEKIKELRTLKPNLDIQVDGSINKFTIKKVKNMGANIFVSGSYILNNPTKNIAILKKELE